MTKGPKKLSQLVDQQAEEKKRRRNQSPSQKPTSSSKQGSGGLESSDKKAYPSSDELAALKESKQEKPLSSTSQEVAQVSPSSLQAKQTPDQAKSESSQQDTITKISPQKKAGRYNIEIDGKFAVGVDEQVLIDFHLAKGKVVMPDQLKQIKKADDEQKTYQSALNYLSYQLRSEEEMRRYLLQQGLEDEVKVERIIGKLKGLNLLDDQAYAGSFVRTKADLNHHGPQKIKQGLLQKGVDESVIDQAILDNYPEDKQVEYALALAGKQVKKYRKYSSRESKQKLQVFLMQRGFDRELIQEVLAEIEVEKSEDEEYIALEKQGERAWSRYSKQGLDDCKQKTYMNLYRKGFHSDLIQRFIERKESEWDEADG